MKLCAFSLATLALCTLVAEEEPIPLPPCPPPRPEPQVYNVDQCCTIWPSQGSDCCITPEAGPYVVNGADVYLTAEFIIWTARQDHMAFVGVGNRNGLAQGKDESFKWKFSPGFKVGVGILFDHDGWDLYANYTWLVTRNTKRTVTPDDNLDQLTDYGFLSTNVLSSGAQFNEESANWEHDFNAIDLELGRNFFVSSCLKLRPNFGLKGTWQKQRVHAEGLRFAGEDEVETTGKHHNHFWGVGMRGGLDTAWQFTTTTSLFGEMTGALLWGQFDMESRIEQNNLSTGGLTTLLDTATRFHSIKPVFEFYGGARWEDWFCCCAYHVALEVGWEIQWWGSQNQFYYLLTQTRLGDLILQGGTIKMRLDF